MGQGRCYLQVVSAALVMLRSSGSLVGSPDRLPCVTLSCAVEPLEAGVPTEVKSVPRTTRTTSPRPDTCSTWAPGNDDATVAAACSCPAEKNTVVDVTWPW